MPAARRALGSTGHRSACCTAGTGQHWALKCWPTSGHRWALCCSLGDFLLKNMMLAKHFWQLMRARYFLHIRTNFNRFLIADTYFACILPHFLFEHWSTGHRLCSLQAGTGEHWALECPPTGGHWRALELECLTDGQALELESEGKWGTPSSSQALCALWSMCNVQ